MSTATANQVEAVAKTLVEKCREGKFQDAIRSCYDKNILSVESMAMPGSPKECQGLDNVMAKCAKWEEDNEVHSLEVSDPLVADGHFAVRFYLDVTSKSMGNQRMQMSEIAVYEVKDGKIVREEFFYPTDKCGA